MVLPLLLAVVAVSVPDPGHAAPITGETQPVSPDGSAQAPGGPALQDPAAVPGGAAPIADSDTTVIEFSVVPSLSDPNKMETVIIVQQKGGKKICVNQNNTDIISRSYRPQGDEPFEPAVPAELRGLTTGDRGDLVGFNDTRVFIRPYTPEDEFADSDECFLVGEVEACFIATEEECDEVMEQGDFVCVGDGISSAGCPVLDHANLMRALRIMIALNNPLGEAPIITAADIARAPVFEAPGVEPGGGPPAGAGGPSFGDTFGGSGGGLPGQIVVPNVVGLPVPAGISILTNAGFVVGTVTLELDVASLDGFLIRSAHAQSPVAQQINCPQEEPDCVGNLPAFTVTSQTPSPNPCPPSSLQDVGTECDLEGSRQQTAAIPEPATLHLFAVGLLLLGLLAWRRRGIE